MEPEPDWQLNYFNYFTEIEEHFQVARGTGLFLLSPMDWALIATWKEAGIPLEAVLRGIDISFEKWRQKKVRTRKVNALAFCAQAVAEEAARMEGNAPPAAQRPPVEAPFTLEELRRHLTEARDRITQPGLDTVRQSLDEIITTVESWYEKLEELEQRLTVLEEKMIAGARLSQSEEQSFEAKRQLDAQLRPYRGKMTAPQLAMLEKQYLDRWLMERNHLPRLSLFYLRPE